MNGFQGWMTQLADDGLGGVLVILLPLGVLVFLGACVALAWAVRSQQFDNLDVEARRILFEDGPARAGAPPDSRAAARPQAPGPAGDARVAPE